MVPEDLLSRFLSVRQTIDVAQSDLHQAALTQFINDGHFVRHIRRTRALYAQRRALLEAHIGKIFGDELQILGDQSGMANLDKVPATGAVIVVSWPKVQKGLGFPARAFAILP